MTAEICLMNRYAAVLAADSAATVTYYDTTRKQRVERYFKGANKIFQLSTLHPVGMMINDSGALHSVPWEIIVKEFRGHVKERAFASLDGYATEFFDFIRAHPHLIPESIRQEHFKITAVRHALFFLWAMEEDDRVKSAADLDEKKGIYRAEFDNRKHLLEAQDLPPHFQNADLQAAKAAYVEELSKSLSEYRQHDQTPTDIPSEELAAFGIETVFKRYKEALSDVHTGIVVVGYGEHDFFPSFSEYDCYGFLLNHLLIDQGAKAAISHSVSAEIKAFAQTSMVDTFQLGLSTDVYFKLGTHTRQALRDIAGRVQAALGGGEVPELERHLGEVEDQAVRAWMREANETHRAPLYRVIGNLPVTEMASLAESLISLQSLKEKVTTPSETVGGPIDVAVITRSEGLVWVKRKLFFDGDLNPRFFMRQRTQYS